ncbi:RHS repeat-associated core domain-containing protein [Kribbella sp. NPDC056345]|uniref:RHS repeat-associated core domain-containing protein n=1 Tax=Kribbella sp. NPDC056345 TaxID=3345789 RepID=UPI0035E18199
MSSHRRRPRRSRAVRAAGVGLLGLTLIITTHDPAGAAPPMPVNDKWSAVEPVSVSGRDIEAKPGTPDRDDQYAFSKVPTAVWPQAGTAKVAVPRPKAPTGAAPTPLLGEAVKAGLLPIKIGAATAANRASAAGSRASAADKAAAASTPQSVQVDLLGRKKDSLVLRVSRADGVAKAGAVSLRVDYKAFKFTYGGDWASRLRVVRLPECALTTPEKTECAGVPLATSNPGLGELSADVPAGSSNNLFAVTAAAAGEKGDAGATTLNPTATWQVGGSSGDFNWSYPMNVPPSLGGPKPELALGYNSGSVDGRTTTSNNQASWVGAGFDLNPGGSIERKYASCGSKKEQSGNNGTSPTGDLCWATDNATFSLNGQGGELVQDDDTKKWHPRNDSGITVERLFGADNGDKGPGGTEAGAAGEYWLVTTKDGTKYYFGLNKLPGATADEHRTNSAWTVPVFGNHVNEPCKQTAFKDSSCDQAYRWNLDYAVDAHGNTMSLFYDTEINRYARASTATSVSKYVRAGNVKRIEYGQLDGEVFTKPAVGKIHFVTANRCVSDCSQANYPDTPFDLECTSDTNCNEKFTPTFWTTKRLAQVKTEVANGTAYQAVSTWTMQQTYLKGRDDRAGLWLNGIASTGHVNGTLSPPAVTFAAVMKNNRIPGTGLSPMDWPRVNVVKYGNGGELAVNYLDPDCTVPGDLPAVDDNQKRCHQVKWTPTGQQEREDWFGKYVVNEVTESDLTTGLAPVVTKVEYLTPPAWAFDEEDGLVEIDRKTWSQFRGFGKVRVTKGVTGQQQSVTVNTFYRGMDGDKYKDGRIKDVDVTDSAGGSVPDDRALAGDLREQSRYQGTTILDRTINDQWVSGATATRVRDWGTTKAFRTAPAGVRQDQVTSTGTRKIASTNTFLPNGLLQKQGDLGDPNTPADDTCTHFAYTGNPAKGIAELNTRRTVVKVACDKTYTNADVLADERAFYDNNTEINAVPTKGDRTRVERLTGFDALGKPQYEAVQTAAYDAIGRLTKSTNIDQDSTSISYTPAGAAPVKESTVTQADGKATTTTFEPAFGTAIAVVDPAGRKGRTELDPLGREQKIWLPGQDGRSTPNAEYEYQVRSNGAGTVTAKTLKADGTQNVSIELYDGLNRKRQVQRPGADGIGRVITNYVYDSRGIQVREDGPFYNNDPLPDPLNAKVFQPNEAELPAQQVTQFDALELPKAEIFVSQQVEQWRTTHTNTAGQETIEPPAGSQATSKLTDAKGRLVELRQYGGRTATGAYDKTTYTYHPAGQLATVTDPAGNIWKFDYDLRGRKIQDTDPDKGITKYTYTELDQIETAEDASKRVLTYAYNKAGQKISTHVTLPGKEKTLLAEWKYDGPGGAFSSSTRYVNGHPYTTRSLGLDTSGNSRGTEVVIPAVEAGLAGTYQVKTDYNLDGQLARTELPAVGGLPAETLTVGFNRQNLPETLTGADKYVSATLFNSYGQTTSITSSRGDNKVERGFEYDTRTQALTRSVTRTMDLENVRNVGDLSYEYDHSGNLVKLTDLPGAGSAEETDTQCFGYDQFRRLTKAWTPADEDCTATPTKENLGGPAPYWHSWTFDKTGNRKTETRTTATGSVTSTYDYPANGVQPHALSKVTTVGTGVNKTSTYAYDVTGSMTKRNLTGTDETFTWDAEGHLESATTKAGKTTYIYDADGNRLLRKAPTGNTLTFAQTELTRKPDGTLTGTRYYGQGDRTVAVRVGNELSWVNGDARGTSNIQINATTQAVQKRRMTPYGEARGAKPTAWPGEQGFHGGTEDASTDLVHMGAREYDPTIGRFISVDPITDFDDPQQLNGYAYANNSPVTFSDSDGRRTVTRYQTIFKEKWETIQRQVTEIQTLYVAITVRVIQFVTDFVAAALTGDVSRLRQLQQEYTIWKAVQIETVRTITERIRKVITEIQAIQEEVPDDMRQTVNNTLRELQQIEMDALTGGGIWKTMAKAGADVDTKLRELEEAKKAADDVKQKETDDKKFEEDMRKKVDESNSKIAIKVTAGAILGAGCVATGVGSIAVALCAAAGAGIGDWLADQAMFDEERKQRNRPAAVEEAKRRYPPGTCHYAMGANICTR